MRARDFSKEIKFKTSRSSGKGGQHVNKVETRVELYFNIESSELLGSYEKQRLLLKLKHRLNQNGDIRITVDEARSQYKNKQIAFLRFYEMIDKALKKEKRRIATKTPNSVIKKRLDEKKKKAETKKLRGKIDFD